MQINARIPAAEALPQARPVFRVLVIYEDFAAGKRAAETCNFLIAQLGDAVECRTSMWKFDLLRNAKLKEIAAADAIEADVIVIAAWGAGEWPDAMKSWFDLWVPHRQTRAGALVALLDGPDEEGWAPACACLKAVAAKAGMDFLPDNARFREFAARDEPPAPGANPDSASLGGPVVEPTPVQHWGLNE